MKAKRIKELWRLWQIAKQRPWADKEPWNALPELLDEIERLQEIVDCKDVLLVAYRVGRLYGLGKTLDKLAKLEKE